MDNIILDIDKNVVNIFSNEPIDKILSNLNLNNYYQTKQTHSDIVHIVDDNYTNNSIGDALITNHTNKPIIIKTAAAVFLD